MFASMSSHCAVASLSDVFDYVFSHNIAIYLIEVKNGKLIMPNPSRLPNLSRSNLTEVENNGTELCASNIV